MEAGGIHLTGYQHMTPLMVAVQQLNADVATALLEGGAAVRPEPPAGGSGSPSGRAGRAHRRPLLLQLLDATAAAAADAAAAAAGPAPAQARDPAGGHTAAAAPAGSGSMAAAASGEPDMAAAASAGSEAVLDASCRLLAALLAHGADPLEQDPTTSRQPTTFLSECLHPALLRLAVIHVQRQCQVVPGGGGRRLTTGECQQLLSAGRRAYAD
ncbi:hypothetical protein COHA_001925 [Chlorella ohadii]|uniref:Uncharacterized protein n=1 Tax=Chlorella ohadii TaxID=2649997 RepID=A0AAD5H950_9CHLO|nr:hypothetical protein COHA_001925 [Chlorella ohadii]